MNSVKTFAAIIIVIVSLTTPALCDEIIIHAVGDVMLAGPSAGEIRRKGYDYPFDAVRRELLTGDINIANLESPLARSGTEFTGKKFRFLGDPAVAPALRRAGFNLVTLANNHSMDFGARAFVETMQHLKSAGIVWIGGGETLERAREMAIFTVKGKKVAFLGYSLTLPEEFYAGSSRPGTAPALAGIYTKDIAAARKEADYVIVSFHWGTEGRPHAHQGQITAARRAIDAGADVVIGHHPHVLQGIERYKKGLILYSLGNFTFASRSRTSRDSAIVRLRLGDKARQAEILPLDVFYRRVRFQPRILSGAEADRVVADLNSYSKPFRTSIEKRDGRYLIDF